MHGFCAWHGHGCMVGDVGKVHAVLVRLDLRIGEGLDGDGEEVVGVVS